MFYAECFYQKDGEWYYTGTYKSLRLEDLTPKEFDNLSQEVGLPHVFSVPAPGSQCLRPGMHW
jgi:Domain of unknown function (DUF6697)